MKTEETKSIENRHWNNSEREKNRTNVQTLKIQTEEQLAYRTLIQKNWQVSQGNRKWMRIEQTRTVKQVYKIKKTV